MNQSEEVTKKVEEAKSLIDEMYCDETFEIGAEYLGCRYVEEEDGQVYYDDGVQKEFICDNFDVMSLGYALKNRGPKSKNEIYSEWCSDNYHEEYKGNE